MVRRRVGVPLKFLMVILMVYSSSLLFLASRVHAQTASLSQVVQEFISKNDNAAVVVQEIGGSNNFAVNETKSFPTASLYKLFVAEYLYAQNKLNDRVSVASHLDQLPENDKDGIPASAELPWKGGNTVVVKDCIKAMIIYSDNVCGSTLESYSLPALQSYISSKGYSATNLSGSNVSSAKDIASLMAKIAQNTWVSADASQQIYSLLKQQYHRHKIPAGLPSTAEVGNKTGELHGSNYSHDSAIIKAGGKTYVLVVLTNLDPDPPAQTTTNKSIADLSRQVYELITEGAVSAGGAGSTECVTQSKNIFKTLNSPLYDPNSCVSSCSAESDGSGSLPGSNNAQKVWNYLRAKGLSEIATAALMGNIKSESGFSPTAENPDSGAFGIVQWLGGRLTKLNQFAADAGSPKSDLGLQLDFMWQELSGPYKSAITDVINSSDATIVSATQLVYDYYEGLYGSGQGSVTSRTSDAQGYLLRYGSENGGGAGGGSANTTCDGGSGSPTNEYGTCSANKVVHPGQYSQAQLQSIFGPPVRDTHANVVTVNFFGKSIPANKLIAPCLKAVEQELISKGVTYRPEASKGGMWCLRDNDGQIGDASYHIYGAACDINPLTNNYFGAAAGRPYNSNCPVASSAIESGSCYDMPPEYVTAFNNHGFHWGGNYNSLKDYMHFEWHGVTP